MQTNNGTPFDGHGAVGSGVVGAANGNRALNFSQPAGQGVTGPVACSTNATMGFGNITAFTTTMWFKQDSLLPANIGQRLFLLGASGTLTDYGVANSITLKFQTANQLYLGINTTTTFSGQATFTSNLPTNKWLFVGIVYDGTNVMFYQGSDTASANLISTTSAPNLTVGFGASGALFLGNRKDRARCFDGLIDDFRFYNGAGSASFVEGIRAELAPLPVISSVYPSGTILLQATNTLSFNVSSASGMNLTNVSAVLNGVNISSQLQYVTNGTAGTSTNLSVSYGNLQPNIANTVLISVTDANGTGNTYNGSFDTFSSTNFIWEAEEFDYNSGTYIDNPDYTSAPSLTSYYGLDSVNGVDTSKGASAGVNPSDYRAGATDGTRTQTPASPDYPRQKFIDLAVIDPAIVDHIIANWSSAEWQNYTKTFPAGSYNVYARVSSASSGILTLSQVTSGQGTPTQTTTKLGTFTDT